MPVNRKLGLQVRGTSGAEYVFHFHGDPKHIGEWRSEGFEIYEVCNTVPAWAVSFGLTRAWCRVQDLWQWLRLF